MDILGFLSEISKRESLLSTEVDSSIKEAIDEKYSQIYNRFKEICLSTKPPYVNRLGPGDIHKLPENLSYISKEQIVFLGTLHRNQFAIEHRLFFFRQLAGLAVIGQILTNDRTARMSKRKRYTNLVPNLYSSVISSNALVDITEDDFI